MFFLLSSGFGLGTLPCRPFLPSLFLMVESWTLTLTEASEACSSLDVVVGSFVTSWMSRRCALGVILVGRPLLGRFTTVPCFHLWIMALTVVCWSPKALEMAYNIFQTDRSQLLSFSFVPEFLWISTWCVAFEDLLVYFTLSGRSYLSDFLIANRCGNNQAWMWLEKLNSGVINHSYVLTGGGGQTLFHTGPCGFGFCFPFIKKTLHLKTACCVYLCYLWLIFKFVWWSETLKCGKHAKK